MQKKGKLKILGFVFILVAAMIMYPFFQCQLKTREYFKLTEELKEKAFSIGCYNNDNINYTYFEENCKPIVDEHNNLIREWAELFCVDKNLELESLDVRSFKP